MVRQPGTKQILGKGKGCLCCVSLTVEGLYARFLDVQPHMPAPTETPDRLCVYTKERKVVERNSWCRPVTREGKKECVLLPAGRRWRAGSAVAEALSGKGMVLNTANGRAVLRRTLTRRGLTKELAVGQRLCVLVRTLRHCLLCDVLSRLVGPGVVGEERVRALTQDNSQRFRDAWVTLIDVAYIKLVHSGSAIGLQTAAQQDECRRGECRADD